MDLVERKEPVPVAAIVDKCRLQGRFDPRYFCQINVAAQLSPRGRFEIEFFDSVAAHNNDPGLFRMRGINEHLIRHWEFSPWRLKRKPRLCIRACCPGSLPFPAAPDVLIKKDASIRAGGSCRSNRHILRSRPQGSRPRKFVGSACDRWGYCSVWFIHLHSLRL